MNKLTFILAFILSIQLGFSQKYWEQSNLSGSFDLKKNYKVAILPVISTNADLQKLDNVAYNKIVTELMACSQFQLINKSQVQQSINKFSFGVSGLDAASYADLAKDLNADIIITCELSSDKQTIKKKEVGTVMAFIQLLDMKNNGTIIYAGKARAMNPISQQSETEYAIQIALKKLINANK
jgi:hypothetical protein